MSKSLEEWAAVAKAMLLLEAACHDERSEPNKAKPLRELAENLPLPIYGAKEKAADRAR